MKPEYSVLSSLTFHNEVFPLLEITTEDMPTVETALMLEAAVNLFDNVKAVDLGLLANAITTEHPQFDWMPHLEEISQTPGPVENFPIYQTLLKEQALKSKVQAIGRALLETGDAEYGVSALRDLSLTPSKCGYSREDACRGYVEFLENPPESIRTGITRLDEALGGFHKSDLIVAGARPSMGKTSLALNVALSSGVPFVFFSGEQPTNQIMERITSIEGGVPLWKLRNRDLTKADYRKVADTLAELKKRDFFIVDRPAPTLQEIVTESRKQVQERGVKLIVVDYIQRMKILGQDMRIGIGDCVRGLKELARELEIPVLALSQVKRDVETRQNKHPRMGDLMESGAIESEADVVLTLYRDYVYDRGADKTAAELSIEKNRHGPLGLVDLVFHPEFVRFESRRAF